MRKLLITITLSILPLIAFSEESIFEKSTIAALANKVRDYRNAQTEEFTNNNWVGGTYRTGLMAWYECSSDKEYLEDCLEWGRSADWEIPVKEKGQYGSAFYSLVCGQIWYECYLATNDESLMAPTIDYLESTDCLNPLTDPLHWYFENRGLRFVDGLYTSPPTFAILYRLTGEEKYINWMDACFWDVYGVLFDVEDSLFYRDIRYKQGYTGEIEKESIRPESIPHEEARTSYVSQVSSNGKKIFWSRGNGWAFGGLTRILKYLPKNHGSYPRYEALFVRVAQALKNCQHPSGFWRPNLADPLDYDLTESSGTSFFTYGITWGINNGILPRDEYLPVVKKSWAALVSIISEEGKVQWGQMPGETPYQVRKDDSTEYGSGIFLLAASEIYKLGIHE